MQASFIGTHFETAISRDGIWSSSGKKLEGTTRLSQNAFVLLDLGIALYQSSPLAQPKGTCEVYQSW